MTKLEIVKKIIDIVKNNNSGVIESGILKLRVNDVTIKYFIPIKELWQFAETTELTKKNFTKKLAKMMCIDNKLELVYSVTELELLVILNELEKK